MTRPLVGLTVSQIAKKHGQKANLMFTAYTEAIRGAGGSPVLIPNEYPLDATCLETLRDVLHGIVLTGGGDIDPALYQAEPDPYAGNIVEARDRLEKALVELAIRTDWPLLGICRGQQMLNAALGGTLYTHIPQQYNTTIVHSQPESMTPDYLVHDVEIIPASRLGSIITTRKIRVNSRHHQAVKDLAPSLIVTARASDGLIEGIELPDHPFCLGVQWHPESLQTMEEQRNIFSAFITAASS